MQKRLTTKYLCNGLLLLGFLLLSSSCVHTRLQRTKLTPELLELAATNERPIALQIQSSAPNLTLGYQFLFMLIPFGVVELPASADYLEGYLYQELTLRGYRPILIESADETPHPLLQIQIDDLSTSAFDFLFIRRNVAEVSVSAKFQSSHAGLQKLVSARGYSAAYRRYGFQQQLEKVLSDATEQAVRSLLDQLRFRSQT